MTLTAIALKGYPASAPLPASIPVRDGFEGPVIGTAKLSRSLTVPGDIVAEVELTGDVLESISFDWSRPSALDLPQVDR